MEELTSDERMELWVNGYEDPVWFCKFYLPHLFSKDMPWVHRGILAIITRKCGFLERYGDLDKIISNFVWAEDPNDKNSPVHPIFSYGPDGQLRMEVSKYTLVMMPRGFSKTTLVGIACVLYLILYKDYKFPVYISETAPHAKTQLLNVKREIESNSRLISVFGALKPDQRGGSKWSEDFIQPLNDSAVIARGRGGQIRGSNVGGVRPDLILFDDVEDQESVNTSEQRQKTKEWFYGAVIPAQDEMNEEATICGLGTLLHSESLLMGLMQDPEWTVIKFGAKDRQGDLLWADKMDEEKLERKKLSYARNGLLHLYYREYFNDLTSADTQKFKQEHIRVFLTPMDEIEHRALALDPAISDKRTADYASMAVVGMTGKGHIKVLDFWAEKGASPRTLIDQYFLMQKTWKTWKNGIESQAYQQALVHLMKEEMFRKKQYFEIEGLTHQTAKVARVEGILVPRFVSGYISFQRSFPLLTSQLLDWPNGKMDGPDVLAMAVALLDPYAALASDGDPMEDEYEPMQQWRNAP